MYVAGYDGFISYGECLVLHPFMGDSSVLAEVSRTSSQLEVGPNLGLIGGEATTVNH